MTRMPDTVTNCPRCHGTHEVIRYVANETKEFCPTATHIAICPERLGWIYWLEDGRTVDGDAPEILNVAP